MFVFIFALLLPSALGLQQPCRWCQDHNANKINPDHVICHPEQPSAFLECELVNGTWMGERRECPRALFYSTSLGACVSEPLSECASSASDHAYASCDHATTPFVCHDRDPSKFIFCARNRLHAAVYSCHGNAAFSVKAHRCVGGNAGDCYQPEAGNLAFQHGAPLRPICRTQYIFHPETVNWDSAVDLCRGERGELATIISERQQKKITNVYGGRPPFWIGANDMEREGEFRWTAGAPLGFARWAQGHPSREYQNNEHCVLFNFNDVKGEWGDFDCGVSRPFLCARLICRKPRIPGGPRVPLPPSPYMPPPGAQLPGSLFPGARFPGQGFPPAVPGYPGQTMPAQFPGRLPGQLPGQLPGRLPGQLPGQLPGRLPGQLPGQMPVQNLPGRLPGQLPGQQLPSQQLPGQLPRQLPGQLPGQLPRQQLPGQQLPGNRVPPYMP